MLVYSQKTGRKGADPARSITIRNYETNGIRRQQGRSTNIRFQELTNTKQLNNIAEC
jgi:hypothetical protein